MCCIARAQLVSNINLRSVLFFLVVTAACVLSSAGSIFVSLRLTALYNGHCGALLPRTSACVPSLLLYASYINLCRKVVHNIFCKVRSRRNQNCLLLFNLLPNLLLELYLQTTGKRGRQWQHQRLQLDRVA